MNTNLFTVNFKKIKFDILSFQNIFNNFFKSILKTRLFLLFKDN